MSLKWCAYTGLLMIAACLLIVWTAKEPDQDRPGVKKRWWDGTVESVEERYADGSLARKSIYGEDGKTLIREEVYGYNKELQELFQRRPDGMVEKTRYVGKTMVSYALSLPDQSATIEERRWSSTGKLQMEHIKSEDGRLTRSMKMWYADTDQLMMERGISETGEQILNEWYSDGKPRSKEVASLQGTVNAEHYYPSGKLQKKRVQDRQTGLRMETFSEDGKTTATWVEPAEGAKIIIEIFKDGKLSFRQTYLPYRADDQRNLAIAKVEEFFDDGKVKREIKIKLGIEQIRVFREDGSVARELTYNGGEVESTTEFDAEGKPTTKTGGEPEEVDPKLLKLYKLDGDEE